MTERVKDRGTRTILLVLAATVLAAAAIVGLFLVMTSMGEQEWADMEESVKRLVAEAKGRKYTRTVPYGETLAGSSWDEYRRAPGGSLGWETAALADFLNNVKGADRLAVEKVVRDRQNTFDLLHLGAHRSDGQYPYNWDDPQIDIPSLAGSRVVALLSASKARFLIEQGAVQEAADLLVDLSVFAADIGRDGVLLSQLVSLEINNITFREGRTLLLSNDLSSKDAAEFARRLEILDRDFPPLGPTFVNEALSFGNALMSSADPPSLRNAYARVRTMGVQRGLSNRVVSASAHKEMEGFLRHAQKLDGEPYAKARRVAARIDADVAASANSLIKQSAPHVASMITRHRQSLARLRLLRVAAIYRATGKVSELDDPLGDKLRHSTDTVTMKFWSVGIDGTDHGGKGDWDSPAVPGTTDIVIEIPR
jgi:hypothetical protein